MNDKEQPRESRPESGQGKSEEGIGPSANPKLPPDGEAEAATAGKPAVPKALTAEEQMARYEEDLKENDWGHQPC